MFARILLAGLALVLAAAFASLLAALIVQTGSHL